MKKRLSRSKLVKKLDDVFSQYIRLKSCDKDGYVKCYTCGKNVYWKKRKMPTKEESRGAQNGHFVSRSNYKYRRDEKNCKPQCYTCNIIYSGNYKPYTCNMIDEYGKDRIDCMINDKEPVKITTPEIEEMIEKYELLVEQLLKKLEKSLSKPKKSIAK